MNIHQKKLIIFDLDGTLAVSKSIMDRVMADLLCELLQKKSVAVISGGAYTQFERQFLSNFSCSSRAFENLFLFPTSATRFYRYMSGEWQEIYAEILSPEEYRKIRAAFDQAFKDINYIEPNRFYGEVIENRGTQVTFSALGQEAPVEEKQKWHDQEDVREDLKKALEKHLPDFEVRLGGLTSIDVTRKGIDKAYGIRQIEKHLGFSIKDMLFVGDALFEGGNDYAVKQTGVECLEVSGPEETKQLVASLLKDS